MLRVKQKLPCSTYFHFFFFSMHTQTHTHTYAQNRSDIPAVSVFQGHIDSVTSTIFTKDDKVLSGSDDKSVKIWELRNMRSPLFTIRTDSAVNRLAVSSTGLIAIPNDNRSIRIFELNGQRINRLQKRSHRRMVTSCCFKEGSSVCNLFSSGFDRKVFGWNISI